MIEKVGYRPLRAAPKLAPLITAVGFSFILQNVGLLWRGGSPESIEDLIDSQHELINILGVPITNGDVLAVGVTFPLVLLMTTFIAHSRLGKAMRATAQEPEAARLMGINVDTTICLTFLLGGMLAGAGGLIYALYQTTIWYFQGFTAGLIAFTAAVMGGIGNLRGAVLGGLIIGIIQQISDNRIGTEWTPADRLRLPGPDHGLPAVRPARRGDEGGRMSDTAAIPARRPRRCRPARAASRRPRRSASRWPPAVAAAIILPFFFDSGGNVMNNLVLAAAYVVMALGLNIIVGFAGLLDLGYVAFFAIGAYTMGYFGSGFCANAGGGEGSTSSSASPRRTCPASTSTSCIICVLAVIATTIAGMIIGLPTLRLRGDYIAIVTLAFGEIIGRIAINGDEITLPRHHAHRRPPGHHAGRQDRPAVRRALHVAGPQTLVLRRARARRSSCCS